MREAPRPGPAPGSYWVEPGRLLAGPYPDPAALGLLLDSGVDAFLDLTAEGEPGLSPYEELLDGRWYRRHPVADFGCPPAEETSRILDALEEALTAGRTVYLHCRYGIGRTGTVAGCYLVRRGRSGREALDAIAGWRGDGLLPETEAQRQLVLGWEEPARQRPRPGRLGRLPEQYFTGLLARVAAAAAEEGEELIDLGRGNPDVPPPLHVVEALAAAARDPAAHGYPPFRGIPELREALAARYRDVYGVDVDPEREVAVVPGTKSAIVELALCLAERGGAILLPDPGYPDYTSGVALAGARELRVPLDPGAGFAPDLDAAPRAAALYLNYPSNPCAASAPAGVFAEAVRWAERSGGAIVHDLAYGDLVFDGLSPASFLAESGARDVGVELFSLSKSYGMAGWRLGFVVGSAEIVERVNLLQDHTRAGVFRPLQEAGVAALAGPQETVEDRRALYERRRDRVLASLPGARSDSTFYVWWRLPEGVTPELLLGRARVAVAPGEGFGPAGEGWARISLAVSDERLDAGLERLRTVV